MRSPLHPRNSAAGACDQLQATAPPRGGAVFLAANVEGWPHAPLGFAPEPDSIARRLFDAATIQADLDHLVHGRRARHAAPQRAPP